MTLSPYITVYTLAEAACLLAAWRYLGKRSSPQWHWHRYYLAVVVLLDTAGIGYNQWLRRETTVGWPQSNHWIHNFQLLLMGAFVSWFLFGRIHALRSLSPFWLYAWLVAFGGAYIADTLLHGFTGFLTGAFQWLQWGVLGASLYYCWLILRQPTYIRLLMFPDFWWVFGTAYFFFGMAVYHAFFAQLMSISMPVWGVEVSRLLLGALNLVLYGFWSYAFYRCRHRN